MQLSIRNQQEYEPPTITQQPLLWVDPTDRSTLLDVNAQVISDTNDAIVKRVRSKGTLANVELVTSDGDIKYKKAYRNNRAVLLFNAKGTWTVLNNTWSNALGGMDTVGSTMFLVYEIISLTDGTLTHGFPCNVYRAPGFGLSAILSGSLIVFNTGTMKTFVGFGTQFIPGSTDHRMVVDTTERLGILTVNASPVSNNCTLSAYSHPSKVTRTATQPRWSSFFNTIQHMDCTNYPDIRSQMYVYELRIYDGALSDSDRDIVLTELKYKWNL